jgi:small conductance mechanosensitive channel
MGFVSSFFENIDWHNVMNVGIKILVMMLLAAVFSMVFSVILRRIEKRLVNRGVQEGEPLTESRKRAQTVMGLVRQAIVVSIWLIAGLIALGQAGVEIGPILAGAGIVGIALGFGAQSLVSDFFAGFFLIMENQVRVGDAARVNGTWGIVEAITFRILVVRDLSGEVHIFPNGSITTLSNLSSEWSAHVFDLGVAYKENTDRVSEVIIEVGNQMRQDEEFGKLIIQDIEIFGVNEFADSAVVIKGRIKTKPQRQWIVGREFNRRIKHAFDAAGIEIPFPHRSLYFGEASNPFAVTKIEESEPAA